MKKVVISAFLVAAGAFSLMNISTAPMANDYDLKKVAA